MVLLHEFLPLLCRHSQQLQGVGIGQIPKRLGICIPEKGHLLSPVFLKNFHEIVGRGAAEIHLVFQPFAPFAVLQQALGLLQPPSDLDGVVQDHSLGLPVQGPYLRCHRLDVSLCRHGYTDGLAHAVFLTFLFLMMGRPALSRLLPPSSHICHSSKNAA